MQRHLRRRRWLSRWAVRTSDRTPRFSAALANTSRQCGRPVIRGGRARGGRHMFKATSTRRWAVIPAAVVLAVAGIWASVPAQGEPVGPGRTSCSSRRRHRPSGRSRTRVLTTTVPGTLLVQSTRDFESPDTGTRSPRSGCSSSLSARTAARSAGASEPSRRPSRARPTSRACTSPGRGSRGTSSASHTRCPST